MSTPHAPHPHPHTPMAAITRPERAPEKTPLSVRYAWHRVSMLGTLVVLLALPWMTSTGCSGDQSPVTETGFELFSSSVSETPGFLLAPLALVLAALLGIVAQRIVRAGRRAWLSFAMLLLVTGGALFVFVGVEAPRVAEHVEHHFASYAGAGALIALILDALVRLVLGVREWWIDRRTSVVGSH